MKKPELVPLFAFDVPKVAPVPEPNSAPTSIKKNLESWSATTNRRQFDLQKICVNLYTSGKLETHNGKGERVPMNLLMPSGLVMDAAEYVSAWIDCTDYTEVQKRFAEVAETYLANQGKTNLTDEQINQHLQFMVAEP